MTFDFPAGTIWVTVELESFYSIALRKNRSIEFAESAPVPIVLGTFCRV